MGHPRTLRVLLFKNASYIGKYVFDASSVGIKGSIEIWEAFWEHFATKSRNDCLTP